MKLIIRHMTQDDIPLVQKIAKISWNATYDGIIPREIQERFLEAAYSIEHLAKRLQSSPFFVANLHNHLVGFANFSNVQNEQAELFAIYLLPQAQGQGVGTALLQHGIRALKNVKSITVCVEKDNKNGLHFYQAKGFQIIEEFDELFDGHTLKTIKMVLKLSKL